MPDTPQAVVPGQTTGTTPPILPSPAGAAAPIDDQTKRILAQLMQAAQQKKFAGQPRPSAVPGKQDPFGAPSYMTSGPNPHAWGAQRLMYGIQSMIKNGVAHQKEEQINKAAADWEYAQSALNEYYAAQSSNDPKQLETAQKKLDVVFGDPKKLKNMAKALNQDWLNPEKTTVYGEALKRVAAKTQQTDQQKQQAKTGLMGLFQKLMQRKQQPQLTDDERQRMGQEIISKAPTTTGQLTPQAAKEVLDIEKASKEARENYATVVSPDGKVWAYNKTNPKDAFQLKDSSTGQEITGQTKASSAPKVVSNAGVPYAVVRGGKAITPGSPEWTKEDQNLFDGAIGAGRGRPTRPSPPAWLGNGGSRLARARTAAPPNAPPTASPPSVEPGAARERGGTAPHTCCIGEATVARPRAPGASRAGRRTHRPARPAVPRRTRSTPRSPSIRRSQESASECVRAVPSHPPIPLQETVG